MSRKPTDIAHVNLRIREGLRRRLEAEAKRHHVSLNSEMALLLQTALLDKPHGDIWSIAQDIKGAWEQFEATREELALWGLIADQLERDGSPDEIVERVKGLVAGPVPKWRAIRELLRQQDREERLSPEERLS